MRKDKEKAVQLRKKGFSYGEISKKLKIPKSTLSYWLRNIELSKSSKDILKKKGIEKSTTALIKRNKEQTKKAQEKAELIQNKSILEINKIGKKELFILGVALYWGEGYKKGANGSKWKCVDFTNSDSEMIIVMMRFFREICNVPDSKFKVQLHTYKNKDEEKIIKFWSNLTKIPKSQFMKSSFAISSASKQKRGSMLKYGTVHIRIYDVVLFHRLIGWITGLKKQSECSSVG